MKDDFESIRAERDTPNYRQKQTDNYAGLWKQVALGILAAYSVILFTSTIGWAFITLFATGTIKIQ